MSYSLEVKCAANNTADVLIEGEIGWEVEASDFVREIGSLPAGTTDINVSLNTNGGSVFQGLRIYNALLDHPAKVNIRITALAASMGSVIMRAGDTIEIAPTASVMIHNPSNIVWGTAREMRKEASNLDRIKTTLITAMTHRQDSLGDNLSAEALSEAMDEETWYTAQEAVDVGLVDGIYSPKSDAESRAATRAVASLDLNKYKNAPEHLRALFAKASPSGPAVAESKGTPKVKFTAEQQAAIDDAVAAQVNDLTAKAVSTAVKEARKRVDTLAGHKLGANSALVDLLAESDLEIDFCVAIMDAAFVVAPEGENKDKDEKQPLESDDVTAIVDAKVAAALKAMRKDSSGTKDLENSRFIDADILHDEDAAAVTAATIAAANKRREAKAGGAR